MFCSGCGTQTADSAQFCTGCGKPVGSGNHAMQQAHSVYQQGALPPGVQGWSWGAFLLNWIWAIGNRTWVGLLALIPYVGLAVAIWLGFKGREMAWKNKQWDSVEHFNRVQRTWSRWAVGLVVVVALFGGVLAAIAIPAYQSYVQRAHATQAADVRAAISEGGAREESSVGSTSAE